jgi:hypothetical protein
MAEHTEAQSPALYLFLINSAERNETDPLPNRMQPAAVAVLHIKLRGN